MPRAAAIMVASLVGLACSNSGLKGRAGDAGSATGGQAGSTISNGTTGGAGGAIGPGGAGAASTGSAGGQAGTAASSFGQGGCLAISMCDPDQTLDYQEGQRDLSGECPAERDCYSLYNGCFTTLCLWPQAVVDASASDTGGSTGSGGGAKGDSGTAGSSGTDGTGGKGGTASSPPSQGGICAAYPDCDPGDQQVAIGIGMNAILPSTDCPAERECYTLHGCGPVMCLLPQGLHCNDSLSCNPGDTQIPQWDQSCAGYPSPCYENMLCGQSIVCKRGTAGGVDAGDGASPRCGDGIVQTGEECDCGHGIAPVPAGCVGPNDDNTYGGCTTECTLGPHCGDGTVQSPPEQCDLGSFNGSDLGPNGCTLGCLKPHYCGDGVVDADLGEQCDLGTLNGTCLDGQGYPLGYPKNAGCQAFPGSCSCPGDTMVLCSTMCTIPWIDL